MNEDVLYRIYETVSEIPKGKVATYGQIAYLVGCGPRMVGKALKMASHYGEYPCHRVVNHIGRLAPGYYAQKELLLQEGISFKENGYVDIKKYLM
ncbi:MAG: MGMT family protein [Bacilli bacterium]|nr:MGMT family protein [Bacilli bacterium]